MGKRQEAALETKKKLIDAVNELLKEKCANEISIEEITTRAGVAKGSFYTYFKRKEDAICCSALEKYNSVKNNAFNSDEGVFSNLCTYLNGSAAIIEKYSLQSAQGWMQSVTAPIDDERRGAEKYLFDSDNIKKIIDSAVENGELSKETPRDKLTEIVMNCYYGAVANWCITEGSKDLVQAVNNFCEYCLDSLLNQYKIKEAKNETQ